MILGLDLGPNLTGFCIGTGQGKPTASAWRFVPASGPDLDLGSIGYQVTTKLTDLWRMSKFTTLVYEAPILVVNKRKPDGTSFTDSLSKLRKLIGLGMTVETWAKARGISYHEVTIGEVKKELTGNFKAEKPDMVAMAEKCGLELPKTLADGKLDAADAFGVWKVGLRKWGNKNWSMEWDRRIYSSRGALL